MKARDAQEAGFSLASNGSSVRGLGFPLFGARVRPGMIRRTLLSEHDLPEPKPTRRRNRSRLATATIVLCLVFAGCSVDETDPTDVTEADGVTGSTDLVEPDDGGSVPTTLGGGGSSSTSPEGEGSSTTTSSG